MKKIEVGDTVAERDSGGMTSIIWQFNADMPIHPYRDAGREHQALTGAGRML